MVQRCSAYNCNSKPGTDISFFRFPKDQEILNKWVVATRRKDFKPTVHMRLCSKHFAEDSYNTNQWCSKKSLRKDAVPSIFDFSENPLRNDKKRKPALVEERLVSADCQVTESGSQEILSATEIMVVSDTTPQSVKKRKVYVGDFHTQDQSISSDYQMAVKNHLKKKNRQIKVLQQQNRRLKKRVCDLTSLLKKTKKSVDKDTSKSVENSGGAPATKALLQRMLRNKKQEYSTELKIFALTINMYSSQAYSYIRNSFTNVLPHPRTLQKWHQALSNSEPGFKAENLSALKRKVAELKETGDLTL